MTEIPISPLSGAGGRLVICAKCGKPVITEVTDTETWDEVLDAEPAEAVAEGTALVCTPCYRILKDWAVLNAPHLLRWDQR